MNFAKPLALALALAAASGPAFAAPVGFSRSCNFQDDFPSGIKPLVIRMVNWLGANPTMFDSLPNANAATQREHWIHEALTANYLSTELYLYAEAQVYVGTSHPAYTTPLWNKLVHYRTPTFTLTNLPEAVWKDPAFRDEIWRNRGGPLFTNARAGDPNILRSWPSSRGAYPDQHVVIGRHLTRRADNGLTQELRRSEAWDCNLTTWGFGVR